MNHLADVRTIESADVLNQVHSMAAQQAPKLQLMLQHLHMKNTNLLPSRPCWEQVH